MIMISRCYTDMLSQYMNISPICALGAALMYYTVGALSEMISKAVGPEFLMQAFYTGSTIMLDVTSYLRSLMRSQLTRAFWCTWTYHINVQAARCGLRVACTPATLAEAGKP